MKMAAKHVAKTKVKTNAAKQNFNTLRLRTATWRQPY